MTQLPLKIKSSPEGYALAPIELKYAHSANQGTIEGYASAYGNVDRHADIVHPGAFAKSLAARRPVMLWAHDPTRPIGAWKTLREDPTGLKVVGELNLDTQAGKEARALLLQGALNGLSIGYRVAPGGADVDRKTGVRNLRELELFEISLVSMPSNELARVTSTKGIQSRQEFEEFLRESGFARRAARKLAGGGWGALSPENKENVAELAAKVRAATCHLKGLET